MWRNSGVRSHCRMAEKDCSDCWNFHFFGWFSIVIGCLGARLLVPFLVWYSALYSINSLSNDILDVTLITTVAHCKNYFGSPITVPINSLTLHISKLTNQWFWNYSCKQLGNSSGNMFVLRIRLMKLSKLTVIWMSIVLPNCRVRTEYFIWIQPFLL